MTASARIISAICGRTWMKSLGRPVRLSFSLVQPMIWMLFLGFLHRYRIERRGEIATSTFRFPASAR
jgi:hypothetical protein